MSTKTLYGYRYAQIQADDALQDIALRELGDASRWADLVWINDLTYPYITGDPDAVSDGVLLWGSHILVPAPTVNLSGATDPIRVFGVDISLSGGFLGADNGDMALVAGIDNLRQAIYDRIQTPLLDLKFHPAYGCGADVVRGMVDTPTAAIVAARYVRDALLSDPRIEAVPTCNAQVTGDAISVQAVAVTASGTTIDLSSEV